MSLVKRNVLLAKVEAVEGTDAVPAPGTDAILVEDLKIKPVGEVNERRPDSASLSSFPHVLGARHCEITFKTTLKGSGAANAGGAGDEPEIDPLLQACGFAVTLTAESVPAAGDGDVSYLPASSSHKSVSIYAYLDGKLYKLLACRGDAAFSMEAGKLAEISWTLKGLYQKPTDTALPAGVVHSAIKPPPFMGANFSIDAYAAKIQNLAFGLNNQIAMRPDANAATGVAGFVIAGRGAQGSFDPEDIALATHDFFTKWETAAEMILAATLGSVAGAKVDISAPKVQYREISEGDREGVRVFDLPCTLARNAGDDELKLKFY